MTSGKKILGITGGVVALLLLGKIGLGFLNQPDDKTLILAAIKDAQTASKEGKPGGVMDFLSPYLKVNENEAGGMRGQIANYIKNSKPEIEFTKVEPQVFGEDARIESPAKVNFGIGPLSSGVEIPNVVVKFKKEEDKEWFIIPRKKWKITAIELPTDSLTNFMNGN
jgi:hypothetical protein